MTRKDPMTEDFWQMDDRRFGIDAPRCHETHPAIEVGNGILLGGNCRDHKRHEGVDLYVALDGSMKHPHFDPNEKLAHCTYYPITNMRAPNRPEKFYQLVIAIRAFLDQGKTVHVGCIGGHGRTGLVLAAVLSGYPEIVGPANDAIGWLRENYCKKAVESAEQEGFLAVHYACKLPPKKGKSSVDKRLPGF
jgi:hypothetical protein